MQAQVIERSISKLLQFQKGDTNYNHSRLSSYFEDLG